MGSRVPRLGRRSHPPEFLSTIDGHRTVVFDCPPTAEHLARTAFDVLEKAYSDLYGNRLRLSRVRLYETPNCWADAVARERPVSGARTA